MKVLLVNGSPHKNGCTYTALCEVSSALNENGISTDIFWDWKQADFRVYCLQKMSGKK